MLFLKMGSIDCSELLFQTVSGSKVWMVSAELSFYMWHFNARKVTPQHFSPTSTFVTREHESKRQPNVCLPSHHRGDGDQTERGTGISFASWKESISHPIYPFGSVIAAAGLWRKDAVCTNSAEGEGCCDWKEQSAEENNLSCKQRDMPQSKKNQKPCSIWACRGITMEHLSPTVFGNTAKHLWNQEKAYQTRAAGQATPREPCPSYS